MDRSQGRLFSLIIRTAVTVGVLVLAIGIYVVLDLTAPQLQPTDQSGRPQQVAVFNARQVPVQRQWRGYGTVDAMDSADVPARVTATVRQIAEGVLAGKGVSRGQLLVELDDSDFARQVEIAQYRLRELDAELAQLEIERQSLTERLELDRDNVRLSRAELSRVEQLFERGAANQKGADDTKRSLNDAERNRIQAAEALDTLGPRQIQLEAQRDGQQSTLLLAQQNLRRCRIISPIDGILQEVDVEVGEQVSPGRRVARVVNLERMEVAMRLPAAARRRLAIHDKVVLGATNQKGITWSTYVRRIAPEDNVSTRTVIVYVEVDQADGAGRFGTSAGAKLLTPGMFVSGLVTSSNTESRWIVPRRSVRGGRVLLADRGTVRSEPVEVDFIFESPEGRFGLPDEQWAVLAVNPTPLKDGDLVLVNFLASTSDGQRVEPVEYGTPSARETTAAELRREAAP